MNALTSATVLDVRHWTPTLFSFTATRDPGFRFLAGQFTMIGLQVDGRPLLRAYSMVNASYQEHLEFLSIKIQSGALTSRLQHLEPGDDILIGRKPTGTLIADNLLPGRNLFLLCTGTGLAPFMSLIREPDIYDRFDRVILVHGCRFASELAYADMIEATLPDDPFIGDMVRAKLRYCPTVTREAFRHTGRITAWLETGDLSASLGLPPFTPDADRVMLCGSPDFLGDMRDLLDRRGFLEGSSAVPGHYVIEKAFVEK